LSGHISNKKATFGGVMWGHLKGKKEKDLGKMAFGGRIPYRASGGGGAGTEQIGGGRLRMPGKGGGNIVLEGL